MPKTKKGRSAAKERANDLASDLADRITPTYETALDKAVPLFNDARDKAAPVLADARDKAAPAFEGAKDRFNAEVLPLLTAAAVAASEATEEVRGETKKRSKAAVAALKGEVEAPEKKTHRFRNFLIVLGLGGIAAAVAKKLSDRPAATTWQSQPSTSSATGAHRAPVAEPAAVVDPAAESDTDQGGASPDVAAADAAAEPHEATTPDDPAETVDLTQK